MISLTFSSIIIFQTRDHYEIQYWPAYLLLLMVLNYPRLSVKIPRLTILFCSNFFFDLQNKFSDHDNPRYISYFACCWFLFKRFLYHELALLLHEQYELWNIFYFSVIIRFFTFHILVANCESRTNLNKFKAWVIWT